MSPAQVGIDSALLGAVGLAVDEIGAVQDECPAGHEVAGCASHQRRARRPLGDVQHVRAVHRVEATSDSGQRGARTSSSSGGRTFASDAVRDAIAASASGSASLGCQSQSGRAAAKCAACWPVPLAISSTAADRQHLRQHVEDRVLVALGGGLARQLDSSCAFGVRRRGDPVRAASMKDGRIEQSRSMLPPPP
jgi:hypothetical protein